MNNVCHLTVAQEETVSKINHHVSSIKILKALKLAKISHRYSIIPSKAIAAKLLNVLK